MVLKICLLNIIYLVGTYNIFSLSDTKDKSSVNSKREGGPLLTKIFLIFFFFLIPLFSINFSQNSTTLRPFNKGRYQVLLPA
jgi:hypothetical protein